MQFAINTVKQTSIETDSASQNANPNFSSLDNSSTSSDEYLNRIMVVDDSEPEKFRMTAMLNKLGHEVIQASNAEEALHQLEDKQVAVILSDWVMPVVNGLDFCRTVREKQFNHPYFILVTGRDSTADLVAGINAGADDFIAKPFKGEELLTRLKAGQRTMKLRHVLESQKDELKAHVELQKKQAEQSKNDLAFASEILNDHLPNNCLDDEKINFYGFLKSADEIGGDFYNFFCLDDNHKGFYLFDVVGHGVPAALFSFMLARTILPTPDEKQGLLMRNNNILRPSQVIKTLNNRLLNKSSTPLYFTMTYGVINTKTGHGKLTQAGSPHPLLIKSNGKAVQLGEGGYPIGIIAGAEYEDIDFKLNHGERLYLYSDGLLEAENKERKQLGHERLERLLSMKYKSDLDYVIRSTYEMCSKWCGSEELDDDFSIMGLEIPLSQASQKEPDNGKQA